MINTLRRAEIKCSFMGILKKRYLEVVSEAEKRGRERGRRKQVEEGEHSRKAWTRDWSIKNEGHL